MVPTMDGMFPNSFIANPNHKDNLMCQDESNEMQSNSLHDYA